jgi:hypothetical protein
VKPWITRKRGTGLSPISTTNQRKTNIMKIRKERGWEMPVIDIEAEVLKS